nr:radical SAM protein [uncultured Desulfobacter sp.]
MIRVAISQMDNPFGDQSYLPYTSGLLQAYVQKHAQNAEKYEFLLPLYRRTTVEQAMEHLGDADVAAFSISIWNHQLVMKIIAELKMRAPDILTVVGGPQVSADCLQLLEDNPGLDVAIHGEGEQIFLNILEQLPSRDFSMINGCAYRNKNGEPCQNSNQERIADLADIPSPYLTDVFEPLMAAHPNQLWQGLIETNRGCPFGCAYCDWGRDATRRVMRFPLDRVYAELRWFAKKKVEFIFCCDANFGLLSRDVDIVKTAAKVKKEMGYPKMFSVQFTKNSSKRAFETQRILTKAGMSKGANLAIQSLHPPALKCAGRKNISMADFEKLQHDFQRENITTFSDLIIGIPGETYDSFADGVETLIGRGQHNRLQFNNLVMLPNAPMAQLDYRKKYGILTTWSRIVYSYGEATPESDVVEMQEIVTGSDSMPPEDWQRTRAFAWMVNLLYFNKLLQIPLLYLKTEAGVNVSALIKLFCSEAADGYPALVKIRNQFIDKARAIQEGGEEFEFSSKWFGIWWPIDTLSLVHLVHDGHFDEFYTQAKALILSALKPQWEVQPTVLDDAFKLNRELIKVPFVHEDRILELGSTIGSFYRNVIQGEKATLSTRPVKCIIHSSQDTWEDWMEWARMAVWYGHKAARYIYDFSEYVH